MNRLRPKNDFLVHGDTPALEWFHRTLSQDLPEMRIIIPEPGVPVTVE